MKFSAFDLDKYIKLQTEAIQQRLSLFAGGKLYFEIGGKFTHDGHASRVLPGFAPDTKLKVIQSLGVNYEIIFCVNSEDIADGREWDTGNYEQATIAKLKEFEQLGLPKPKVVFTLYTATDPKVIEFRNSLEALGYLVSEAYRIAGYPENLSAIVSPMGFGKNHYVKTNTDLVLVVALGSNSGKMATCLSQVYQDSQLSINSGYAKWETFPIWNLPTSHPVNLAYEAATVDIADYNLVDPFHLEAYSEIAVNYNRDVEAFPIVKNIIDAIVSSENGMVAYKSPTDMGINKAGFGISNEIEVIDAAIEEIKKRKEYFYDLHSRGRGKLAWAERCQQLFVSAKDYDPTIPSSVG